MKFLRRIFGIIWQALFGSANSSYEKRNARNRNTYIKEMPESADTQHPPYRSNGITVHRAPDGTPLPEFSVVCHFKDDSIDQFTVWAEDSATANWAIFFVIEELVPHKGHLLESIDVSLTEGTVQDGLSTSGSYRALGDSDPLPPKFYN